MMDITIPGTGKWRIKQLVLDLNGTIALDGKIIEGVAERLNHLSRFLDVFIVTPDTRGNAERVTKGLKVKLLCGSVKLSLYSMTSIDSHHRVPFCRGIPPLGIADNFQI